MKFFLAVCTFLNVAMADNSANTHPGPAVSRQRSLTDSELAVSDSPEVTELELALTELNQFAPTRSAGETGNSIDEEPDGRATEFRRP